MHGKKFKVLFFLIIFYFSFLGTIHAQINFSEPKKLSNNINSEFEESLPISFKQVLYFVRSFYPKNTGGLNGGQDIWYTQRLADTVWSTPNNQFPVFNNTDNNAIVGISQDGNRIYLMNSYHLSETKSIRLEVSEKEGKNWSIPKRLLIKEVSAEGKFSGFYMHPSEKILLISMKGKEVTGGEDIYVCLLDQYGRWTKPKHLGNKINTKGFEISPFLSLDTKTLYFSSNGRKDSKDSDIYYSKRLDNSWQNWSEPIKLPEGINSDAFDAYFFISEDDEALFVSNRDSRFSDIYIIKYREEDLLANESTVNSSESIDLESINSSKINESTQNDSSISPSSLESLGTAYIYFEFASAEITEKMEEMLKYIAAELKKKDDYQIELLGYADDLGPKNYNKILSKKRAESVKRFLVDEGLMSQKIVSIGKGMLFLSEKEVTENDRQKNRRVELLILN